MSKPMSELNRRTFLKGAAGSTAALVVSTAYSRDLLAQETDYMRAGYSFFSPSEVPIVEALAEQIWPGDENTVGGRDAGVAVYIDRALSGAYTDMQPVYRLGLDWVDQVANEEFGANFVDLSAEQQVAFLETHLGMPETTAAATPAASPAASDSDPTNVEVEGMQLPGQNATPVAGGQGGGSTGALAEAGSEQPGDAEGTIAGAPMLAGGDPPAVEDLDGFLQIFRTHTIEGLFADPVYGGNRDKRVWADLHYGGPYYVHTEEQQLTMDSPLDIPIQSIVDL
ncbi:MAG TPA: gluconate 2-dehydrogenase subunit 3 family protein [Thermomicrobiales bacterium]|nr:gluconate 2-dehydrogenase subunit 3 family protein [Thermomicrobiales bacterium]